MGLLTGPSGSLSDALHACMHACMDAADSTCDGMQQIVNLLHASVQGAGGGGVVRVYV